MLVVLAGCGARSAPAPTSQVIDVPAMDGGGSERARAPVATLPKPHASSTDDIPVPSDAGVAPSAQCSGTCAGTASKDLIDALTFATKRSKRCYDFALKDVAGLEGKIVVKLRADPAGGRPCSVVTDVVSAAPAPDAMNGVAACVTAMLRDAALPATSGGCVDVNVPVVYRGAPP